METCEKGFYTPSNNGANDAKTQALYIRKYGKKAFLSMQDRLHKQYKFSKIQDIESDLKILEDT